MIEVVIYYCTASCLIGYLCGYVCHKPPRFLQHDDTLPAPPKYEAIYCPQI